MRPGTLATGSEPASDRAAADDVRERSVDAGGAGELQHRSRLIAGGASFPPVGQRPWSQRSPGGHIRWKGPEGGTATPPRAQGTRTRKGAVPRRVSRGPQLKRPRVPRQMAIPEPTQGLGIPPFTL